MKHRLKSTARPSRFLKPGRSLLLLMFLVFCTTAFATPTTPTSDFIDNGDGTVTHKLTGLVWMRCAMGQTWDKATSSCTGTAATYTWDEAMVLKSDFAGYSDWRLPNIAELNTIIELENYKPAINTAMFPNTPYDYDYDRFWSSSPNASSSSSAWVVHFGLGNDSGDDKNRGNAVRLVRMRQWLFGSLPLTTPTVDFTDNKDGTVTHKRTGLVWQRCSVGQTWTGSSCSGTATAYTWNAAMALKSTFAGHNDWRVPNQDELLSIVEYGTYNPAINTEIFPNASDWFWSSSPHADYSGYAWLVGFGYGYDSYDGKNYHDYAVRLVRVGQWILGSLDMLKQSSTALDFSTAYDAKNAQTVELKNTSANPIEVSNVLISDAKNYWANLFVDSQWSCRAKHSGLHNKNFTIPAQSSCFISIGFSPFDNLTAGKSIAATMTLKTTINGIATDKVIKLTGIGRAQVATLYSDSESSMKGQWGVTQLKGGNPPLKTYGQPKTWYSEVIDPTTKKLTAHSGNVVVFAGNNLHPTGKVGVVIQTNPVVVMLTNSNIKNQNGNIERQWAVKPVNWYSIKNHAALTWQPLITGVGTTSNRHYGFIDWNSTMY